MCPGRPQEIEGVAVVDKKVILYGGEGNVSIFRSGIGSSNNCPSEGGIRPSTKGPWQYARSPHPSFSILELKKSAHVRAAPAAVSKIFRTEFRARSAAC